MTRPNVYSDINIYTRDELAPRERAAFALETLEALGWTAGDAAIELAPLLVDDGEVGGDDLATIIMRDFGPKADCGECPANHCGQVGDNGDPNECGITACKRVNCGMKGPQDFDLLDNAPPEVLLRGPGRRVIQSFHDDPTEAVLQARAYMESTEQIAAVVQDETV